MDARQRLVDTYGSAPEIGLVLGAGVSVQSGVPNYATLATGVLALAEQEGRLNESACQHHRLLAGRVPPCEVPPPDVILTYARAHIASSDRFHQLVREVLYRDVAVPSTKPHEQRWPVAKRTWTKHKTVAREIFHHNATIDAVISFCAAEPGARHARRSSQKARAATNRRVGAILTTNYDNLVEASFGTKYMKSLLPPVGRSSTKLRGDGIPVYHCHGYVTYPPGKDDDPPYSELLIAEEDYYSATYDPGSFGNTAIARVLHRMPCLFIGSAMTDRNLRRHLLLSDDADRRNSATVPREHFAILPEADHLDDFTDAVLARYRVSVIRIKEFSEIPGLLRDLYVSPDDTTEGDWDWTQLPFGKRDALHRERRAAIAQAL